MWCFSGTAAYDPHSRVWCRKLHMARVAGASEAQRSSISITTQQSKANSQERKEERTTKSSKSDERRAPITACPVNDDRMEKDRRRAAAGPWVRSDQHIDLARRKVLFALLFLFCAVVSFAFSSTFCLRFRPASSGPAVSQAQGRKTELLESKRQGNHSNCTARLAGIASHRSAINRAFLFPIYPSASSSPHRGSTDGVCKTSARAHDALWKKRIAFAPKTFVVLLYLAASFACCSLGRLWNRRGTPGKGRVQDPGP